MPRSIPRPPPAGMGRPPPEECRVYTERTAGVPAVLFCTPDSLLCSCSAPALDIAGLWCFREHEIEWGLFCMRRSFWWSGSPARGRHSGTGSAKIPPILRHGPEMEAEAIHCRIHVSSIICRIVLSVPCIPCFARWPKARMVCSISPLIKPSPAWKESPRRAMW